MCGYMVVFLCICVCCYSLAHTRWLLHHPKPVIYPKRLCLFIQFGQFNQSHTSTSLFFHCCSNTTHATTHLFIHSFTVYTHTYIQSVVVCIFMCGGRYQASCAQKITPDNCILCFECVCSRK